MKKIYINETSLGNIKEYGLLPDFLFKMVKDHKTSLGDNEAFPKVGEFPFDYSILKKRFEDVSFHIKSTLNEFDEDSLMSELSSLVTECKELEEPIKDSLEKLAENSINRLFAIPNSTVNFTFKLVDKVEFKNSPRITPESDENIKYSFKDVADIDHSNKAVEKRRFINSLIQGGARRMLETALSSDEVAYADLGKLNPHLITLYKKILYINDYLLFTKPEKLDDKKPMQGSYVETHLGSDGNRSTIDAQGILFPLLLQEAIKGLFELFSSHGLPGDRDKAMYVIKKADYILAEPWDMRFGPTLWDMVFGGIEDSNLVPYAFTSLIGLPTDEFNTSVREILANTETGGQIINDIIDSAKYDSDYQQFKNRIDAKNMDKAVIADSYFTAAELDGLEIDSEEDNVIEEDKDVDYMELIENATVDNIDFEEGRVLDGNGEELILTINGVKIPPLAVSLVVYVVGIEVDGKPAKSLNLHIMLAKSVQGMGLGTKIYTKMVYEFGSLYSWDATRTNKEHIGKIFKRLADDPKIEVTTIPGKEGGVDYLAVLKGHDIFEGVENNKTLITEGWAKDKKRIIDRCVKLIKGANPTITTSKAYSLERKIEGAYFHEYGMSSSLKIRKFEPMITKILVEELGYPDCPITSREQNFLKDVAKCIWNYEVKQNKTPMANGSFEGNGPDNFDAIVAKYKPFIEEIEKSGMTLSGKKKGESDYNIMVIPDFETANKWGDWSFPGNENEYGKLCYTTHTRQWDNFTNGGINTCFLCLNEKTYQNWPINTYPKDDENTPYDGYGLSMIWVFVDQNGNLVYSNTRWNHHGQNKITSMPYGGKGVDESFSEGALEKILGVSFDDAFKTENSLKAITDVVNKKLEQLNNDGNDHKFDEYFDKNEWNHFLISQKLKLLKIANIKTRKENILSKKDDKWRLVFPDIWFDEIKRMPQSGDSIIAIVQINKTFNLLDSECNFVLPNNLWCDKIIEFESVWGHAFKLEKNRLFNVFVPGKGFIYGDKFIVNACGGKEHVVYALDSDGSITVYPPNGSPISLNDILENYLMSGGQNSELPSYLNGVIEFDDYKVRFNGKSISCENVINPKTGKLLKFWVKRIEEEAVPFYKLFFDDNHVNILSKDGKLFVNKPPIEWPSNMRIKNLKYYIVEGNERDDKENICDLNGNFLFDINDEDSWVTDIDVKPFDLLEGQDYLIGLDDFEEAKFNIADENLNLLWKQPKDKWFDRVKNFNASLSSGLFPVKIGEGWNYFSVFENDMLYKQPMEDWFLNAQPFPESALITRVQMKNNYYNFIDINGNLLFENSFIADYTPYSNKNLYVVKDVNGKENIIDLEIGDIVSDEWFDEITNIENKDWLFMCKRGNETVFYNTTDGNFIENKGKYSSHDFSDYASNLKKYLESHGIDIMKELIPNELYVVEDEFPNEIRKNLVGIVNGKAQFLLPEWCRGIGNLFGSGVICRINSSVYNIFDISKLHYVFDTPMECVVFEDGFFVVTTIDAKNMNIVDENCNVILKKWPKGLFSVCTDDDGNYLYQATYDDGDNIFCPARNGFLIKKNYGIVRVYSGNFIVLGTKSGDDWVFNLLGKNGEPAFDEWVYDIEACNQYYAKVNYSEHSFNIYNPKTSEFISDEPLEEIKRNGHYPFYKLVKNGKVNYLTNPYFVRPVLPDWADTVINDFEDGKYGLVVVNGQEYTIVDNDKHGRLDVIEGDVYGLNSEKINNLKQSLVQAIKNSSDFDNGEEYFNGDAFIEGGDAEFVGSINGIKLYRLGYHLRRDGVPEFYGYRDDDSGEYVVLDINPNDISEIIRLIH